MQVAIVCLYLKNSMRCSSCAGVKLFWSVAQNFSGACHSSAYCGAFGTKKVPVPLPQMVQAMRAKKTQTAENIVFLPLQHSADPYPQTPFPIAMEKEALHTRSEPFSRGIGSAYSIIDTQE